MALGRAQQRQGGISTAAAVDCHSPGKVIRRRFRMAGLYSMPRRRPAFSLTLWKPAS